MPLPDDDLCGERFLAGLFSTLETVRATVRDMLDPSRDRSFSRNWHSINVTLASAVISTVTLGRTEVREGARPEVVEVRRNRGGRVVTKSSLLQCRGPEAAIDVDHRESAHCGDGHAGDGGDGCPEFHRMGL
jgi:hypothetical protein